MRINLCFIFLICASFYQRKEVKLNVINKKDNSRIDGFKVFYKPHGGNKYQMFNGKNGFSLVDDDEVDILIITKRKRVLFEQIDSKYLKESIRFNFHISDINNRNASCVYYYNLAVSRIGKNKLNEEDCNDILFVIGPLNDNY